mgnify:CR=1 FL=1
MAAPLASVRRGRSHPMVELLPSALRAPQIVVWFFSNHRHVELHQQRAALL